MLLQQWVTSGENCDAIESTLKLSRSQEGEMEREKKLLTISQMKAEGFSAQLELILMFFSIYTERKFVQHFTSVYSTRILLGHI